ncbi:hypothetical protein V5O48_005826 [Marasmius crinis-equi]|uniref:Ribonuclease H1 N-terminal domain-containing protein n=1 Tax=Marasmius crinis-equi TaxID=585013 RepID=A0ABR3FLA8_9AGAR
MASQAPKSREPLASRLASSIRPPSPVNRETGSHFKGGIHLNLLYSELTVPLAGYTSLPGSTVVEVPKLFSSCQTDVDRATTTVKTTVEQRNGWVITTTIKIQRIHPDLWADHIAQALADGSPLSSARGTPRAFSTELPVGGNVDQNNRPDVNGMPEFADTSSDDLTVSDLASADFATEAGTNLVSESSSSAVSVVPDLPSPANTPVSSAVSANLFNGVPHPSAIRRPTDDATASRYYVVFVGRQVGIVRDDWPLVRRLVDGVSGACQQRYKTFDKALLDYYRAWKGIHANGWTPKYVPDSSMTRDELAGLDLNFDDLEM